MKGATAFSGVAYDRVRVTIILEFSIEGREFALGAALGGHGEERIELERIIPVGKSVIPFFWVEGGDQDALAESVLESGFVENLARVDDVASSTLFRVEWTGEQEDLLHRIKALDATVLEAESRNRRWEFRLRFPDHKGVGSFHRYCAESGIEMDVQRVYPLTEEALQGRGLALTPPQREAVFVALDEGYFEIPREASLEEVAGVLGISEQAASERLRRATATALRDAVLL